MTSVAIFTISGLAIVMLIAAKKLEEKQKRPLFISNMISKGDIRIRDFYHRAIHLYSEGKEKVLFFFKKQISMHSRNSLNKLVSFLKERRRHYISNIRNSRLLKKPDGMSEFFKNMSDIEKGNGEINDVYEDTSPNDRSVGRGSQDDKKEVR
ncbi:MAG: hypothetical protein Q8P21_01880 [bacterium]|nr:hypothetical protein [bacterium]